MPSLLNNTRIDINNNPSYNQVENNFQNAFQTNSKNRIISNSVNDEDIRVIVNNEEIDIKYPLSIKNDQLKSDFGEQLFPYEYN